VNKWVVWIVDASPEDQEAVEVVRVVVVVEEGPVVEEGQAVEGVVEEERVEEGVEHLLASIAAKKGAMPPLASIASGMAAIASRGGHCPHNAPRPTEAEAAIICPATTTGDLEEFWRWSDFPMLVPSQL